MGSRDRVDLGDHAAGRSFMTVRLESVTFTSGDGETSIPSYLAIPERRGPHPVVLILRGVAGPDDGYTEIARRLAEWGYVALVHGWKIRGTDPGDEAVYADLRGAITFLESLGQVDLQRLAVFGFCRGGVHAVMAARAHPEIRVIVVFHGFAFRPAGAEPGVEPFDLAEGVNVPMLVLHGTEDERAPIEGMRRMEARMQALGKVCTFTFYDGARHGFAVRTHPGYAEDAARQSFDAARRFLATYLPVAG
jgi:carboxymethylenebutenolidase